MEYFKKYYPEIDFDGKREVKVLCPFHGDSEPSAQINTEKNLFHCFVCKEGMNEEMFISKTNDISIQESIKLLAQLNNSQNDNWELHDVAKLWSDATFIRCVENLGITKDVMESTKLGLVMENSQAFLGIPVYYNNIIMDIKRYNILKIQGIPKIMGNENAPSGMIIPYDLWKNSTDPTYIMEGEKDMLVARSQGLNAITLTGGAGASPNSLVLGAMKDREFILAYDNDEAGRTGMNKLAKALFPVAKSVHYVDMAELVKEDKEDFTDYIMKYQGTGFDFLMTPTKEFELINEETLLTPISKALENSVYKKNLFATVTVTSEYTDTYTIPTYVEIEKMDDVTSGADKYDTLQRGEKKSWVLSDTKKEQFLDLIEVDAKNTNIKTKLLGYLGTSIKEQNLKLSLRAYQTIYRVVISDKISSGSTTSIELYSFERLDVGKQYLVEYKLVNHPSKNQKVVAIAYNVKPLRGLDEFKTNAVLLSKLKIEGTIQERLNHLYQSAKHHIAKHLNFETWLFDDMVFNSILDFDFGGKIRGALDVFMIGDTQVGKSETAQKLVELYNFGQFLSLKTSTTIGLIGGSNKVDGTYCNTIGAIPRQHEQLVVLEEFSGAKKDFIKTMTDIRSSNELRIARVSGELRVPCKLRMITISNPINDENGNPRFLSSFPNGVIPIMELITSAEDVARYDGFILIPKVEKRFNPFENQLTGEPIPKECYEHKANWVITRGPNSVVFEDGVQAYIWEQGEILNTKFECNFPLFGTTTDKKLARFSVALASLILNTDESMEKIVVTKEIVDYVCKFLDSIYSNPVFNLNGYKEEYDSYNQCNQSDVNELNRLYPANSVLIETLSKCSKTSRNSLRSVSGLDGDKFSPIFNQLVAHKFVRMDMESVYPTGKFRKCYDKINRNFVSSGTVLETSGSIDLGGMN